MLMVMFVNDYDGDCVFAHMRSSIWLFGNDYDKGTLATVTVTICSPAFSANINSNNFCHKKYLLLEIMKGLKKIRFFGD